MKAYLLRRRRLGRTSCREISNFSGGLIGVYRNDNDPPTNPDLLCIRWGCTSTVEQSNVLNKATAIHLVSNKTEFRKILNEHKLCPTTYTDDSIEVDANQKLIVRPQTHHQGRHLYVTNNSSELLEAINNCGPGWYASQFIDKIAEYRVFVAQGRAVWVAKKTPANPADVAWNVAQGGRFDNVRWDEWPLKAVKYSIKAMELSDLDFGGVDVMVDRGGNCYVLEINSAPSQTSPYRQECVAKAFTYIINNGKAKIPLIDKPGGYKKFIHPAICLEALCL